MKLENYLQLGYPVLLEDFGESIQPPMLEPLIYKQFIKQGGSFKVKLGDKNAEVSFDFRLYITSKLHNPLIGPEISARITLLNFTVTQEGLEDQILNVIVKIEDPLKEK
jgi:dynein heavy chain